MGSLSFPVLLRCMGRVGFSPLNTLSRPLIGPGVGVVCLNRLLAAVTADLCLGFSCTGRDDLTSRQVSSQVEVERFLSCQRKYTVSTLTICTVYLLYIQHTYYMYSILTISTVYLLYVQYTYYIHVQYTVRIVIILYVQYTYYICIVYLQYTYFTYYILTPLRTGNLPCSASLWAHLVCWHAGRAPSSGGPRS